MMPKTPSRRGKGFFVCRARSTVWMRIPAIVITRSEVNVISDSGQIVGVRAHTRGQRRCLRRVCDLGRLPERDDHDFGVRCQGRLLTEQFRSRRREVHLSPPRSRDRIRVQPRHRRLLIPACGDGLRGNDANRRDCMRMGDRVPNEHAPVARPSRDGNPPPPRHTLARRTRRRPTRKASQRARFRIRTRGTTPPLFQLSTFNSTSP